MRIPWAVALVAVFWWGSTLLAKDETLKDALDDNLVSDAWIYEDIDAGYAKAKETGKPLLVSFRCVP